MSSRYFNTLITALPLTLSVLLPCIHLYSIRTNPSFQVPVIDSGEYVKAAGKIVNGSLLTTETDHLSLLYTWFVASIFSMFGVGKLLPVKLFQILLNLGSAFLLYKTARAFFSRREGVVSLYIWALYGPVIFFTCEITSLPLILFMYNLSVFMLFTARREKKGFWWAGTGLAFALSVLARPDILIFTIILTAVLFFKPPAENGGSARKRAFFLCFVSGVLAPLLLASFIKYSSSGNFSFLPADSGLNFYIGNNPGYPKTIGARPGLFWDSLTELPDKEGGPKSGTDRNNRIYYSTVFRSMRSDFPVFSMNVAYKVLTLFNGYELPSTLDIYTFSGYSIILSALTWSLGWFSFPFGILLPLAALGIWFDRRREENLWLLVMLLSFFVSLIGFWNSSRYRMVLIPILIVFTSGAVVHLYSFFAGKRLWKNLPALAVAIIFSVICNVPYQHFSKNYNFDAEMYAFTGIHLAEREKNYQEALKRLEKSVDLQKQNDSGCSGYPFFMADGNECGKILSYYQSSLKGHTYLGIGYCYLQTGAYEKSRRFYEKAIETGAVSFLAYNNLGTLMARQEKFGKALNYLEKSVELRRDYPVSHADLGIVLMRTGRPAEAVDQFAEAVRLGADNYDIYYNLAAALAAADAGRDAVVSLMKSLNIRRDRAMMVFGYMKKISDETAKKHTTPLR